MTPFAIPQPRADCCFKWVSVKGTIEILVSLRKRRSKPRPSRPNRDERTMAHSTSVGAPIPASGTSETVLSSTSYPDSWKKMATMADESTITRSFLRSPELPPRLLCSGEHLSAQAESGARFPAAKRKASALQTAVAEVSLPRCLPASTAFQIPLSTAARAAKIHSEHEKRGEQPMADFEEEYQYETISAGLNSSVCFPTMLI